MELNHFAARQLQVWSLHPRPLRIIRAPFLWLTFFLSWFVTLKMYRCKISMKLIILFVTFIRLWHASFLFLICQQSSLFLSIIHSILQLFINFVLLSSMGDNSKSLRFPMQKMQYFMWLHYLSYSMFHSVFPLVDYWSYVLVINLLLSKPVTIRWLIFYLQ